MTSSSDEKTVNPAFGNPDAASLGRSLAGQIGESTKRWPGVGGMWATGLVQLERPFAGIALATKAAQAHGGRGQSSRSPVCTRIFSCY